MNKLLKTATVVGIIFMSVWVLKQGAIVYEQQRVQHMEQAVYENMVAALEDLELAKQESLAAKEAEWLTKPDAEMKAEFRASLKKFDDVVKVALEGTEYEDK